MKWVIGLRSRGAIMVALLRNPSEMTLAPSAERRMFTRTESRGSAHVRRLDHSLPALRVPRLDLSLRDISIGGCAANTETPLLRGERVAISFPSKGFGGGWDAVGRVIRCEPSSFGYRVAVEFESLPAA